MKAVVIRGIGSIGVEDLQEPKLRDDEVLAAVKAVGICGTDLEIYRGKHTLVKELFEKGALKYLIPGHEWSGIIVSKGEAVDNLDVGDRITSETTLYCGKCYFCAVGKPNLCDNAEEIGITRNGAMAEYVAIPAKLVHEIPQEISFEEAALIEPTAVALHAVKRTTEIADISGKKVAIFGDGTIGLLILQLVLKEGPREVFLFGKSDHKLSVAEGLGPVNCVNISARREEEVFARIKRALRPRGADIVIEAAPSCPVLEDALSAVKKGGTIMLVGLHGRCDIDVNSILFKELVISSSLSSPGIWDRAIELVRRREVRVKELISDILTLEGAVDFIKSGGRADMVKAIVRPGA